MTTKSRPLFFDEGIQFECTRCNGCCRGGPGTVYLNTADLKELTIALDLDFEQLALQYLRIVDFTYCLIEKENFDCIFWEEEGGCRVYERRPTQCRTFPFWILNMRTLKAWRETMERCPGIGTGRVYTKEEILERLHLSWHKRLMY